MKNVKNEDGSEEVIDPLNDIDNLIKQSKMMLNEVHKIAASKFAELMVTEKWVIQIEKYIDELNLDQQYYDAFIEEIGRKVPCEITGPEIHWDGSIRKDQM